MLVTRDREPENCRVRDSDKTRARGSVLPKMVQTGWSPFLTELSRFGNSRNVEMTFPLAAMLTAAVARLGRNESRRAGSEPWQSG